MIFLWELAMTTGCLSFMYNKLYKSVTDISRKKSNDQMNQSSTKVITHLFSSIKLTRFESNNTKWWQEY